MPRHRNALSHLGYAPGAGSALSVTCRGSNPALYSFDFGKGGTRTSGTTPL